MTFKKLLDCFTYTINSVDIYINGSYINYYFDWENEDIVADKDWYDMVKTYGKERVESFSAGLMPYPSDDHHSLTVDLKPSKVKIAEPLCESYVSEESKCVYQGIGKNCNCKGDKFSCEYFDLLSKTNIKEG